jgi:hypothetical protein
MRPAYTVACMAQCIARHFQRWAVTPEDMRHTVRRKEERVSIWHEFILKATKQATEFLLRC